MKSDEYYYSWALVILGKAILKGLESDDPAEVEASKRIVAMMKQSETTFYGPEEADLGEEKEPS